MPGLQAVVKAEEAEALARQLNLKFYRTCVRENFNVSEVFAYLADLHAKRVAKGKLAPGPAAQSIASVGSPPGPAPPPQQPSGHDRVRPVTVLVVLPCMIVINTCAFTSIARP
jgi:Ras-related protein Rab-23